MSEHKISEERKKQILSENDPRKKALKDLLVYKRCNHNWTNKSGTLGDKKQCTKCGGWQQASGTITCDQEGKMVLDSLIKEFQESFNPDFVQLLNEAGIDLFDLDDPLTLYHQYEEKVHRKYGTYEKGDCARCAKKNTKTSTFSYKKTDFGLCFKCHDLFYKLADAKKKEEEEEIKKIGDTILDGIIDNPNKEIFTKYAKRMINQKLGEPLGEAVETPEYNTDMTEAQAKQTLATLSQQLINDWEKDKDKKFTQYTANIYANIITKNLLPHWAKGFKKLSISLDSYQSFNTLEFITPAMSQDFVSRFINGRETLNGFVHRSPDIRIKMSPRIFHSMKEPNDAYNFFKAAVQYYDSKVQRYGQAMMRETMKLGHNMKHLIGNSKLSGIVTYPLSLVFVFDDVNMTDKETFKISQEDIETINKFVRNIMTRYAAPEKEKKQIVDDVKEMVKALREAVELNETGKVKPLTETVQHVRELYYLPEALEQLFSGGFNDLIKESSRLFIEEQIDHDFRPDPKLKELYEATKVKKLKKIPNDIVAYISIEAEAIRDANDKMMIASYCLSKLEIVEWYIELLEVGSNRYVVPHSKPYLEGLRTQLLACFKKIMDVKITNPQERPIIDIQYPKNYEG